MKPLRLKMQAFGSYGKEKVIDFEKVNHIIDEKRKGSIEFLLEALKEEK